MGPIKYHNVVAWIPGTTFPDEWVIMGGHFDCFDSGTGGVDDGSGFSPGMEALRLLAAAGASGVTVNPNCRASSWAVKASRS